MPRNPLNPRRKPDVTICACGSHAFSIVGPQHVALVSVEDSDLLAAFNWRAWCPHKTTSKDVRKHVYYARRSTCKGTGKSRTFLLHREITGTEISTVHIDHINHNGLDCRRPNLRPGTRAQNYGNQRLSRHNTSGFKGVAKYRGKWRAACAGKHIGVFDMVEEAALAYDRHAMIQWGDRALLNFPMEAAE